MYKKKAAVSKPQSQPTTGVGSKDIRKEGIQGGHEGGEGEELDDGVVFDEGSEGSAEVNESSNAGEGENDSANKLVDFLDDLSELPNLWQSTENTQSLGELWYHLLK